VYYVSASKLKNVSYALVEAGLLYAKDSTRVWDQPRCQIITNINNQHLEWVKPKTLKAICQEKVGYLSKKTTIYVGKQEPKTMQIIKKILKKNPSRQVYYGSGWTLNKFGNKRVYKDNKGKIILKSKKILSDGLWDNVGLAIRVAKDLKISKKTILKTLPKLQFEGRLQYVKGKLTKLLNPQEKLLIDGCHSEASAKNLASYLKSIDKDIYGIWGMQKHKHPELFIKQFKGIFKKIITVKIPDETNSCEPLRLKQIANRSGIKCDVAPSIESAIKLLSNKKPKVITFFGSLYLIGKILSFN
jgi:folylpolyglutamate synthase/dihydropteroate synthase